MIRFCRLVFIFVLPIFGMRVENADPADGSRRVRLDSSAVGVRSFSPQKLNEFGSDKNFLYDREPPSALTFWEQLKARLLQKLLQWLYRPGGRVYWRIVMYVFVAAVLFFTAAKLLKTDVRGLLYPSGVRLPAGSGGAAEDIYAIDFAAEIDAAIRREQYRPALRLSFLARLKKLAENGLIDWKIDKTNRAYLQELKREDLRPAFAEIVALFEYTWYGELAVDQNRFQRALEIFKNFDSSVAEAKGREGTRSERT